MSTTGALLLVLMLSHGAQAKSANDACLAYTAKREAENQSLRAVKGVVEVVQHRMKQQHKSCRAIVSQRGQFSWWRKNIKMKNTPEWLTRYEESRKMRPVLPSCATFFHSGEPPSWAMKKHLVRVEQRLKFYC